MTTCLLRRSTWWLASAFALLLLNETRAQDPPQPLKLRTREEIQADLDRPIARLSVDISDDGGERPPNHGESLFEPATAARLHQHLTGTWMLREFNWEAPEYWHQPFYFEDVPLEYYGLSQPLLPSQVLRSTGRFYLGAVTLPLRAVQLPPWSCVSNLGTHRPGSPVPCIRQRWR